MSFGAIFLKKEVASRLYLAGTITPLPQSTRAMTLDVKTVSATLSMWLPNHGMKLRPMLNR